jgi:hypothetical protein
MKWILLISIFNSDDLLVKEYNTQKECVQIKKEFLKKVKNKSIKSVSCEEGTIMESYTTGNNYENF